MIDKICDMEFLLDDRGEEILLKDGEYQVMMEWERPYMEACIDALQPHGDVLEIGFGCGYSAYRIQKFSPKSHTIIEYHPLIAKKARKWAEDKKGVRIIEDTWQNALPTLDYFDCIFFDDYPLESGAEMAEKLSKAKESSLIVEGGKKMVKEIEQKLPLLKTISYKKIDLNALISHLKKEKGLDPAFPAQFIYELKRAGSISDEIFHYGLELLKKEGFLDTFQEKERETPKYQDRLFTFLDLCLKKHMRKGANFSCYLEDPSSKFEDDNFYQKIILNPDLEYKEHTIPIQVPEHCKYYKGDTALVITIKKMQ